MALTELSAEQRRRAEALLTEATQHHYRLNEIANALCKELGIEGPALQLHSLHEVYTDIRTVKEAVMEHAQDRRARFVLDDLLRVLAEDDDEDDE